MGNASTSCKPEDEAPRSSKDRHHRSSSVENNTSKSSISGVGPMMTERAKRVVGELQASLQNSVKKLEENDHPAAQLLDQVCGGMASSYFEEGQHTRSSSFYSEDASEDESSRRTVSDEEDETTMVDDDTKMMSSATTVTTTTTGGRRGGKQKDAESASYVSQSDMESELRPRKRDSTMKKLDSQSMESESSNLNTLGTATADLTPALASPGASTIQKAPPLASSFAKRCYFTKAGIGKTTQHYEGLTLTGNVVLMLAAAMKLKGCPTICDEDLRRVEQTYPNQFSRLPDELLLSSGWRRISKYCHFSNKPIPDGVPFFHSKQRLHPGGGYYFLLAAAVGMVRPIDVEPLTRDTLVLLETDYPTQCDAAPQELIQDPSQWTLVDKFCFFSGGPINTEEDVYYQADFDGNPIFMLAFLSPSLTPEELYKLNESSSTSYGLKSVAAVEEVESVYDLTERDFDDLKLYHLGPCRALPQYLLQPHAWTKVLPPRFLAARQKALVRAQEYEMRYGGPIHAPVEQRQLAPGALSSQLSQSQSIQHPGSVYGAAPTPLSTAYYGPDWGQPSSQPHHHHMPQQPHGISPAYMSQPPMHAHPDGMSVASSLQYENPVAEPYFQNAQQPQGVRSAGPHQQNHFNYSATPSPYASQSQYDPYGFEGSTAYSASHPYYNQNDVPGTDPVSGYYEGPYHHQQEQHHQQQEQQSVPLSQPHSNRSPQYPEAEASSFQREVEEEGAFVDDTAPMDEAIATRAQKVSPQSRYRDQPLQPDEIKEDITDPPDDYDDEDNDEEEEEEDDEPPSLSRQKWPANSHRHGDSGFAANRNGIMDPRSAYYGDDGEDDDLVQPQKVSNVPSPQGESYETDDQPESHNGVFYDDGEYYASPEKGYNGRGEPSYYQESSPTQSEEPNESTRSDVDPVRKSTAGKANYLHKSNNYQYEGHSELMQSEYDDDAYDPIHAQEDGQGSADYYRTVPNLTNELDFVHQKRQNDMYPTVDEDQTSRSTDNRHRQHERENGFIPVRGDSAAIDHEQWKRSNTEDVHQRGIGTGSSSPTSEYTHSSAMRGAQELLKRNRQKRLQMAIRKEQEIVQEPRVEEEQDPARSPQTRTDEESGGTWESGSEVTTSVISGSSVWTDSSNNADRSSRRALILQMAKARMKSNKERVPSHSTVHSEDRTHIPITEETEHSRDELIRDTRSEVNTDIDFAGDLD